MRIGIIARGLTRGGVTRYLENILSCLNKENSGDLELFLITDNKKYQSIYKNISNVYVKKGNKIFWDYIKIIPSLYSLNLDVLIYPKNIIPFTHIFFTFKKINIVHDLAYFDKELNEYNLSDTIYMRLFLKLSCNISNKVIAVSDATRSDIIKRLSISRDKIDVIKEGVGIEFSPMQFDAEIDEILAKYNIKIPFLFYCGSLSPRKNILRTLEAFNAIKDQIPHNIYLAGGQSWHDAPVREYIKNYLSNRVFLIGYVTDKDLPFLYSGADLYLYPSFYEGFGLPILEAQACGCAVLTSDRTSCPEVAGDGAVIVDPNNVDQIEQAILRVLSDFEYRIDLIKKGHVNCSQFTWPGTTKKILEICHSIVI